eukprot:9040876-Alexandrium_andersonii.AAC.1
MPPVDGKRCEAGAGRPGSGVHKCARANVQCYTSKTATGCGTLEHINDKHIVRRAFARSGAYRFRALRVMWVSRVGQVMRKAAWVVAVVVPRGARGARGSRGTPAERCLSRAALSDARTP